MRYKIVIFGEAEKGQFKKPYFCNSLDQLIDYFGNPPNDTNGLELAIQSLLFKNDLLFFRVHQEGYSRDDYLFGLNYLEQNSLNQKVDALGMPGVGDRVILDATKQLTDKFKCLLIVTEKDLYDFMTQL